VGTTQTGFVTITCDGPNCEKNVTFEASQAGEQGALQDNPWLNNLRHVAPTGTVVNGQRIDRKFTYCSDECEVNAAATGAHNKLEQKRIQTANAQQAELIAKAAAQAAALKSPIVQP
jgi:hypothetical protein